MKIVIDLDTETVDRMKSSTNFRYLGLYGGEDGAMSYSPDHGDWGGTFGAMIDAHPEMAQIIAECYKAVRKSIHDK